MTKKACLEKQQNKIIKKERKQVIKSERQKYITIKCCRCGREQHIHVSIKNIELYTLERIKNFICMFCR